jgi:phosphoenolpyruvate carboxykinase (GTP)
MKFGEDGRLYAINPEAGFFGVAPGTSMDTNPNAILSTTENTIFTNVALTHDNDVWWEGKTKEKPEGLTDWKGKPVDKDSDENAAHPNARFTAPAYQNPVADPNWEDPKGVPISAILFGGRRANVIPLVYEAFNWQHGTFIGSIVSSETTAAAAGETGKIRHDPFAMLPFCGYNMGDYFKHWINIGKSADQDKLPGIFFVNWFRRDDDKKFLWPGFGDNIRVLKWIFGRLNGEDTADKKAIGYVPKKDAIDLSGITVPDKNMEELLAVKEDEWLTEVDDIRDYYKIFGDRLPEELTEELFVSRRL